MRLVLTLVLLTVLPALDLAAQAKLENPHLIGVWRLDLEKSRYSPGPPPAGEVRTYTRDQEGVAGKIERRYRDGRVDVIEYRAGYDHDYPVSGTRLYDMARFRRVDDSTTEGVLSHAGKIYGYSRRTISPDGKTLTITFRRTEPGDMVNNVAVYQKQ